MKCMIFFSFMYKLYNFDALKLLGLETTHQKRERVALTIEKKLEVRKMVKTMC